MGVRVAAHAEGLDGTRIAIEQGVDTIEHGLSLHSAPELLAAMAERGQVLVPTLTNVHDLSERFVTCFAPVLVEQAKRQQEEAYLTLEAARSAGVRLAMGHDSWLPGDNAIELVRRCTAACRRAGGRARAAGAGAAAMGLDELGVARPGATRPSWCWMVDGGTRLAEVIALRRRRERCGWCWTGGRRGGGPGAGRADRLDVIGSTPLATSELLPPPTSGREPAPAGATGNTSQPARALDRD